MAKTPGNISLQIAKKFIWVNAYPKEKVKYIWLTVKGAPEVKIYLQRRTVSYADYVPGMYYISPNQISTSVKKSNLK